MPTRRRMHTSIVAWSYEKKNTAVKISELKLHVPKWTNLMNTIMEVKCDLQKKKNVCVCVYICV